MVENKGTALCPDKIKSKRKFAFLPILINDKKVWFKTYYRLDVYFKVLLDEVVSFKLTYNFSTLAELKELVNEYNTINCKGCDIIE